MSQEKKTPLQLVGIRIVAIVIVLVIGVAGFKTLVGMKKPPKESERPEAIAKVIGVVANRQDFQTYLSGYGTVQSHQVTELTPEVIGRVIEVHPDLEVGNIVPKGEVLFRIDPINYQLAVDRSEASLAAAKASVEQLRIQNESNKRQLKVTERMTVIAENEYNRFAELVAQNQAESISAQENAEMALVREKEKLIMMENSIEQFESDLAVANANVKSAESQLNSAKEDLDRTVVRAPFDSRVVSKNIEIGKLASMNQMVVELADDSVLEVPVSIDGSEIAKWLKVERAELQPQWFKRFNDYPVEVTWTSDPSDFGFAGTLDRVSSFDTRNRTFNLVAQIRNDDQSSDFETDFPLANGMFCEVIIPGKIAENVIPVPRDAVDSQGMVMVANENLLESRSVKIVRIQQDVVLISEGLNDGDIVLTRRPSSPIEGMKLEVSFQGDGVEGADRKENVANYDLSISEEVGS